MNDGARKSQQQPNLAAAQYFHRKEMDLIQNESEKVRKKNHCIEMARKAIIH